jgi:hypothetical protein
MESSIRNPKHQAQVHKCREHLPTSLIFSDGLFFHCSSLILPCIKPHYILFHLPFKDAHFQLKFQKKKYFEHFELNKIRSGIQQWERHDDREKRCVETSEGQGKLSQWVVSSAASIYGCVLGISAQVDYVMAE